jgi:ABC-type sugar transport system permease subunit
MNDLLAPQEVAPRPPFGLWLLGLALLVPGLLLYFNVQIQPALDTIALSQTDGNILREPEFVGMANYDELLGSDSGFEQALFYSVSLIMGRLLVVAFVPIMVGVLAGGQRFGGRVISRLLLALISVLLSPVAIAVLLSMFLAPFWGRSPSPIDLGQPLASPKNAAATVQQIDMLITMGIAAVVGGTAFMAVLRGREVSFTASRAGIGIWLLGLVLVLASLPQTFELPWLLTQGGPARATSTITLELFNRGFQFFEFGYAAAIATILLIYCAVIGLLIGLLVTLFGLRLRFAPAPRPFDAASVIGLLNLPLLALLALPFAGLFVWGVWLSSSSGAAPDLSRLPDFPITFTNTTAGAWQTIWLTQIPTTYLLALALGFMRPFGRLVSNIIFILLTALAFLPVEALMLDWYLSARELGILNTTAATGYSWQVGGFSLLVLKLFFDGAAERYQSAREAGQPAGDAFLNMVLLPSLAVTLVVGVALSFAATSHLLWPLITTTSADQYGFPLLLATLRARLASDGNIIAAYTVMFVGLVGTAFLAVFALLHLFVLDRLAIVAGPSIKPKNVPRTSQAPYDPLSPTNPPDIGGFG